MVTEHWSDKTIAHLMMMCDENDYVENDYHGNIVLSDQESDQ